MPIRYLAIYYPTARAEKQSKGKRKELEGKPSYNEELSHLAGDKKVGKKC